MALKCILSHLFSTIQQLFSQFVCITDRNKFELILLGRRRSQTSTPTTRAASLALTRPMLNHSRRGLTSTSTSHSLALTRSMLNHSRRGQTSTSTTSTSTSIPEAVKHRRRRRQRRRRHRVASLALTGRRQRRRRHRFACADTSTSTTSSPTLPTHSDTVVPRRHPHFHVALIFPPNIKLGFAPV